MMEGVWISIIEYASLKKVSISTIRRYIKANRVKYKSENGKYFIFVSNEKYQKNHTDLNEIEKVIIENKRLQSIVRNLQEEIDDLKTLVNLYESSPVKHLDMSKNINLVQ